MCQACGLPGVTHERQMPRRAFMFGAAAAGAGTLSVVVGASARESGRANKSPRRRNPRTS